MADDYQPAHRLEDKTIAEMADDNLSGHVRYKLRNSLLERRANRGLGRYLPAHSDILGFRVQTNPELPENRVRLVDHAGNVLKEFDL